MEDCQEAMMVKQGRRVAAGGAVLLGLLLSVSANAAGQAVSAVAKLDLDRFVGAWYEIARYPDKPEKECLSDAMKLFALGDKKRQFAVVTACMVKDGNSDAKNSSGKLDKSGVGKLKTGLIWPLTKQYWVMAIGPEYEWALVGSPNHKMLWVLSRTATMKPEILAQIEDKAVAEGFDKGKMVMVAQRH